MMKINITSYIKAIFLIFIAIGASYFSITSIPIILETKGLAFIATASAQGLTLYRAFFKI